MSDDLRKAFEEMKADLKAVQEAQRKMRESMDTADTRFSNFVARFDEVSEM